MPSRIDQQLERGSVLLQDTFGVSIKYQRETKSSAAFTAEWRERAVNIVGRDGYPTRAVIREYIVETGDLNIGVALTEPAVGDRVLDQDDGNTYEVCTNDANLPAYELMSGGYRWLLRTKRVKQG